MNALTCYLNEPFFSALLTGEKTVIARIRKGKWDNVFVGDLLYVHRGLGGTRVDFEIVGLLTAANFDQLYATCGTSLLPASVTGAYTHYKQQFSPEEEMCYGVLGIVVRKKEY